MIDVEFDVAYLPWYNGPDPRKDLKRRAADPIECGVCETALEWKSQQRAYCPSCRRSIPAGTNDADHLFAKNYTLYVRK